MRITAFLLTVALSSAFPIARAQDTPESTTAAQVALGTKAVHVITSRYILDGILKAPKTGKPLSKGHWSIDKQPPKDCPQTEDACVGVFYRFPEADVICAWTVLLNGDGSSGRVLEENDDAARYLIVNVSQVDAASLVAKRIQPTYPPIAEAAHMKGDVELRVTLGIDGVVEDVRAISGPEMLKSAAIDGVNRWRFKPLMIGSRAVRFQTTVTVSFTTNGPGSSQVTVKP